MSTPGPTVDELRARLRELGKPSLFARADLYAANAEVARWERGHPDRERRYRSLVIELTRAAGRG